jgi:group I intron endonuclease
LIIYKATNKINGKGYIGQTINLEKRLRDYKNTKTDHLISRAIRKYGFENFSWEIICECFSKKEMDKKEKYYIIYFDTRFPNGYNLTDGGEGNLGWIPTEETRKKMSAWQKGKRKPPRSKEWCENISKAKKGKKLGPLPYEVCKKMSKSRKGIKRGPLPEETKRKISESLTGKKRGPLSDDHKRKIGLPKKGKKRPPFSKEWKKNMSLSRMGIKNPMFGKKRPDLSERNRTAKRSTKND